MGANLMQSIVTVAMFALFVGIVLWTYDARRKPAFEEAARLPLEEDDAPPTKQNRESEA